MNAKDRAEMDAFIVQLKAEFTVALQPLIDKIIELEQRSSNFAARVNSHSACYRAEIAGLRDEVAALRAGKVKQAASSIRVPHTEWTAARNDLMRLHPNKHFTSVEVRDHALAMAAAPKVKPLVGYTEGDPALEDSDDEFAI